MSVLLGHVFRCYCAFTRACNCTHGVTHGFSGLDGNLEGLMDCTSLGASTASVGCCSTSERLFSLCLRTAGIVTIVINSVGHGP